ncbi:hypothetical protein [Lichenicoccus sp.]|uniref:hypothetical protein n=1 Tax=Lichenicoccus sp. TaxID=2781899 RepID=UPI003D09B690
MAQKANKTTASRTDPELWNRVKQQVTAEAEGGNPGQWSARKAQRAVRLYKQAGGGYDAPKSADNHLSQWTDQDWGTRSGEPSGETGERYLPRRAREGLSRAEYDRTTAKKRADTAKGRQFSKQPADIARKTAAGPTRAELLKEAARHQIRGRSRMTKAELGHALRGRS